MERKGEGEDGNGEGLQLSRIAVGVVPFPQPLSRIVLFSSSRTLLLPFPPRSRLRAFAALVPPCGH